MSASPDWLQTPVSGLKVTPKGPPNYWRGRFPTWSCNWVLRIPRRYVPKPLSRWRAPRSAHGASNLVSLKYLIAERADCGRQRIGIHDKVGAGAADLNVAQHRVLLRHKFMQRLLPDGRVADAC